MIKHSKACPGGVPQTTCGNRTRPEATTTRSSNSATAKKRCQGLLPREATALLKKLQQTHTEFFFFFFFISLLVHSRARVRHHIPNYCKNSNVGKAQFGAFSNFFGGCHGYTPYALVADCWWRHMAGGAGVSSPMRDCSRKKSKITKINKQKKNKWRSSTANTPSDENRGRSWRLVCSNCAWDIGGNGHTA